MLVNVDNRSSKRMAFVHVTALPLDDFQIHPTLTAHNALTIHDATAPGSVDYVHWEPITSVRQAEFGNHGDCYPSGYLKTARISFPVVVEAGVHRSQRSDGINLDYWRQRTLTITQTTSTAPNWAVHPLVTSDLGSIQFELFRGGASHVRLTLSPTTDEELFADFHGTGKANVKCYRAIRRADIVGTPSQTNVALLLEVMYRIQRDFGGGGGHLVTGMISVIPSDNRHREWRAHLPERMHVECSYRADIFFPFEQHRMPEWTPSVYAADGRSRTSVGSGTCKLVSGTYPSRLTKFVIWDPDDRNGVGGVTRAVRENLIEPMSLCMPFILALGNPANYTQNEADTLAGALENKTWRLCDGISPDHKLYPENWIHTGRLPGRDERRAFASDAEAFEAAQNQSLVEFDYSRSQGSTGETRTWSIHDPLARGFEGFRPDARSTGPAANFGYNYGWKHAHTGCGDVRHALVSCLGDMITAALNYRETDGSRLDPRTYGDATSRAVFGMTVVPMYNGYTGWASNFGPVTLSDGRVIDTHDGGKRYSNQGTFPAADIRQIGMGQDGGYGNRMRVDGAEKHIGGGEVSHSGWMTWPFMALLTADEWILDVYDAIELHAICGNLTDRNDDCQTYWRRQFVFGELPESAVSNGPNTAHNRNKGRIAMTTAQVARVVHCPEVIEHMALFLGRSLKRWATGSEDREVINDDPTRTNNREWGLPREFSPLDVPELWSWHFAGHDVTDPAQVTIAVQSGQRKYISGVRNWQGDASRAMTVLNTHRGAWPGGEGGIADLRAEYPLNQTAFDYSIRRSILSAERWPASLGNTDAFGPVYLQNGTSGMNATGEFLVAMAGILTRTAGTRQFWGSDDQNYVEYVYGAGTLWMVIAGGTKTKIAENIPLGPCVITVSRDAANSISVHHNDVEVAIAGSATIAGTFNVRGFGWHQIPATNSYFDDFLFEIAMFRGAVSFTNQRKIRDFLRFKWKTHARPIFSLSDLYDEWATFDVIPTLKTTDFGAAQTPGTGIVRGPVENCFEMAQLAMGIRFCTARMKEELARTPGDAMIASAVDFGDKWHLKATRFFGANSFSSNFDRTQGGVTGLPMPYFRVRVKGQFDTPALRIWNSVTGAPDDPDNPGFKRWEPVSTWSFAAQHVPVITGGIAALSHEKDWFLQSTQIVDAVRRWAEAFAVGSPENPFGWGAYDMDGSTVDKFFFGGPPTATIDTSVTELDSTMSGSYSVTASEVARISNLPEVEFESTRELDAAEYMIQSVRIYDIESTMASSRSIESDEYEILHELETELGGSYEFDSPPPDTLGKVYELESKMTFEFSVDAVDVLASHELDMEFASDNGIEGAAEVITPALYALASTMSAEHDLEFVDGRPIVVGVVLLESVMLSESSIVGVPRILFSSSALAPNRYDRLFRPLAHSIVNAFGSPLLATFESQQDGYDVETGTRKPGVVQRWRAVVSPRYQASDADAELRGAEAETFVLSAIAHESAEVLAGTGRAEAPRPGSTVRFIDEDRQWTIASVRLIHSGTQKACYIVTVTR